MAVTTPDIIQLGLGWAGAISATRLAQAGCKVLVINSIIPNTNPSLVPGYSWQLGDPDYFNSIVSKRLRDEKWESSYIWNVVYKRIVRDGIQLYTEKPSTLNELWDRFCSQQLHSLPTEDFNSINFFYSKHGKESRNIRPDGIGSTSENEYFYPEFAKNANLKLMNATIEKLEVERGVVVGVVVKVDGEIKTIPSTNCRVILSLGVIANPQLLQLSGIGPSDLLTRNGISVKVDNPHVGAHFKDSVITSYYYQTTITTEELGAVPTRPAIYMMFKQKPYLVVLSVIIVDGENRFKLTVFPMHQPLEGSILINGNKMSDSPTIEYPNNFEDIIKSNGELLEYIHSLLSSSELYQRYQLKLIPGDHTANSRYINHGVGTTRMGISSIHGVVDARQRVFGVNNLYVSSNSIYPHYTGAGGQAWAAIAGYQVSDSIIKSE